MAEQITKLSWILIQDNQLLCVKSKGIDCFYLPGGKVEQDETHKETLIREIREELSVHLLTDSIEYLETVTCQAANSSNDVEVVSHCYRADFLGILKPSNEISEYKWIGLNQCSPVSNLVKHVLENQLERASQAA